MQLAQRRGFVLVLMSHLHHVLTGFSPRFLLLLLKSFFYAFKCLLRLLRLVLLLWQAKYLCHSVRLVNILRLGCTPSATRSPLIVTVLDSLCDNLGSESLS